MKELAIGVCNGVTFEFELFEPESLVRGTLNEIAQLSLVGKGLLLTAISTTAAVYIYIKKLKAYDDFHTEVTGNISYCPQ